jgi:hypothetical protein
MRIFYIGSDKFFANLYEKDNWQSVKLNSALTDKISITKFIFLMIFAKAEEKAAKNQ